jgi:hypothetical protein
LSLRHCPGEQVTEGDGSGGVLPSRPATRRARRRSSQAPVSTSPPDPLTAILAGVVALQAAQEELTEEVRQLRRRMTALASKVELLGERLDAGESTTRLRATPARRKRATDD